MEEEDDIISQNGLEFLPSRLSVLVDSTPEEWAESFRQIDKNVSALLERNEISVVSHLSRVAFSLSYWKTLKSLCDFCMGPQFDARSRQTLCNLLILFSRLAIKLDEPDSVSLSSSLMTLSQDLTKFGNYQDIETHPVNILAKKLAERYRELPEF